MPLAAGQTSFSFRPFLLFHVQTILYLRSGFATVVCKQTTVKIVFSDAL